MSLWTDIADRWRRFIQKQDTSGYVEPPGIGVKWLWKLPDSHPFYFPAVEHDRDYDLMRAGKSPWPTSEAADFRFYKGCVHRAADVSESAWDLDTYLIEARTFYQIVRAWGALKWKPGTLELACSPWRFDQNQIALVAIGVPDIMKA